MLTLTKGLIYITGQTPQTSLVLNNTTGVTSSQEFIIGRNSADHAEGYITITYPLTATSQQTEQCHINFLLSTTGWSLDTLTSPATDNFAVIPVASVTPAEGLPTILRTNCLSANYNLAPQAGTSTTLTLNSGSIYLTSNSAPQNSIVLDSTGVGLSQEFFIAAGSAYAEGYVTVTYSTGKGSSQTAECHINFFLASTGWAQDTTAGSFPNDNTGIIAMASTTPAAGSPTNIAVSQPTGGTPSGIDSSYQVLNPEMVFLVDRHFQQGINNTSMLFRGNTPFAAPTTPNGQQSVDFESLHTYMQERYVSETGVNDFPATGEYTLCVVCLQSQQSEHQSIKWEFESFGGTSVSQLANDAVFVDPNNPQHMMVNWQIEPHNTAGNDVFDAGRAQRLSDWMNFQSSISSQKNQVYYIHCASGHDRTGIVASSYMIANRQLSLTRSLIYGTTIAKAGTSSGQVHADCLDLNSTAVPQPTDPNRSRLTMIAKIYDTTVLNIYNTINSTNPPVTTLPADATSVNPPYVYSTYPWEKSI